MGRLVPLGMTAKQLVVASTILTIYFPCIATFAVLVREIGVVDMLKSTLIMMITTLLVGGFVNYAFQGGSITLVGWLIIALVLFLVRYIRNINFGKQEEIKEVKA